jgi:nicotinamidase-related amidase
VTDRGWLVAIDLQRVFGDPSSQWRAPRYAAAAANVARLASAWGDRVVFTRFVAPAEPTGAWVPYYREFPWALEPADSELYELTNEVSKVAAQAGQVVTATTFGKWGEDLRAVVGDQPRLVVGGVATDCCVISTVLAAADAGADITVVTDACAGSTDDNHQKALDVMGLYAPLVSFTTTAELLDAS